MKQEILHLHRSGGPANDRAITQLTPIIAARVSQCPVFESKVQVLVDSSLPNEWLFASVEWRPSFRLDDTKDDLHICMYARTEGLDRCCWRMDQDDSHFGLYDGLIMTGETGCVPGGNLGALLFSDLSQFK